MSKSYVEELLQVYRCVLTDVAIAYPALSASLSKDLARIESAVEDRGLNAMCVDLPRAGKHLDRCLSEGVFKSGNVPFTKRYSPTVVTPRLLSGLYQLVFDPDGLLKEDYDAQAIICLRQVLYLAKKVKLDCQDEIKDLTIRDFIETDLSLPRPHRVWGRGIVSVDEIAEAFRPFEVTEPWRFSIDPGQPQLADTVLEKLTTISGFFTSLLGPFRIEEWRPQHGPGAVGQVIGPVNKYTLMRSTWTERLDSVFPISDCGFHNYASWAGRMTGWGSGVRATFADESPSRLISVQKTLDKPRLIAAEPVEMQWCQQMLKNYFYSRVPQTLIGQFIKFDDQTLNQELCTRGSVDGSLVTVDLSAASDRVTPQLVGTMFRSNPELVRALIATRTRRCKLPSEECIELRKFSTMGSACTFPVQSLIFLTVAIAAVLSTRKLRVTATEIRNLVGSVAVYGDDIIVPQDSWGLMFDILKYLSFKVNVDKSFCTGRFRESCGVDAFDGHLVTPVYYRQPADIKRPETVESAVEVMNRFYRRFYTTTSSFLSSTIPMRLAPVPIDSGIFGRETRLRVPSSELITRYNRDLHQVEALLRQPIAVVRKQPPGDDSGILQYFTEDPSPYDNWEAGYAKRPLMKIKRQWVPVTKWNK